MYDKIASKLDDIAEGLESKGLLKEARDLDIVANTLEAAQEQSEDSLGQVPNGKEDLSEATVGINKFVLRQTKPDFAGTKISRQQLESIRNKVEMGLRKGQATSGTGQYKNIKTVRVVDPSIKMGYAEITPENRPLLKTRVNKRTEEEREVPYEQKYFDSKDVPADPSNHIDIILYPKSQLESENSNPTGADYDVISVNAEGAGGRSPMTPETLRRNQQGKDVGGSGAKYTPEQMARSKEFWNNHAMVL